jgi:hypothetical protein
VTTTLSKHKHFLTQFQILLADIHKFLLFVGLQVLNGNLIYWLNKVENLNLKKASSALSQSMKRRKNMSHSQLCLYVPKKKSIVSMSSTYFNIFLNQLFQERSSLCTLETICSDIVDCLLTFRHALYILIKTYGISLIFRRMEAQQWSKALVIPCVLNATKLDKLAKALPKLLIVLQNKLENINIIK